MNKCVESWRMASVAVSKISIDSSVYLESERKQQMDRQWIDLGNGTPLDDYKHCT